MQLNTKRSKKIYLGITINSKMKLDMKNILVIGLGSMGYGIAESLIRSGYKVFGQDKNPAQEKKIVEDGGFVTDIPYTNLDAVIIVVLNESQTREIIFGSSRIFPTAALNVNVSRHPYAEAINVPSNVPFLRYICSMIPGLAGSKPFHHSVFVVELPLTELPSPNTHSKESISVNGTRDTFL